MPDGGLVERHRDITELRLAEVRAEQARQELIEKEYAIDQAVIVAITDLRGTITYANDRLCEISGYSRAELLGKNHRILKSEMHSREFFARCTVASREAKCGAASFATDRKAVRCTGLIR